MQKSPKPLVQMGHATAEAVVEAGLDLVPWSFTGESEAVVVGNVGVSGIPVQLIGVGKRQEAMERVKHEYPGLVMIDFTLPGAVNGDPSFESVMLASQKPFRICFWPTSVAEHVMSMDESPKMPCPDPILAQL